MCIEYSALGMYVGTAGGLACINYSDVGTVPNEVLSVSTYISLYHHLEPVYYSTTPS